MVGGAGGLREKKGGRSGQERTEAEDFSEAGAFWLKYRPASSSDDGRTRQDHRTEPDG